MWPIVLFTPIRPLTTNLAKRFIASSSLLPKKDVKQQQNFLFNQEIERQAALIPRIEKIQITLKEIKPGPEEIVVLMNKGLSTPHHCAQHVSTLYKDRSVVAQIGDKLVDMHYPLQEECELRFRHFEESDAKYVNKVYWRSCSFLLGLCIQSAFRSDKELYLHSYPKPDPNTGSFVYDVKIPSLINWKPTQDELYALNTLIRRIRDQNLRFEKLLVSKELAGKIFENNSYKSEQITRYPGEDITLYRLGDHIDMSVGPMIPDTSFIGSIDIVAVHQVDSKKYGQLYRFQGTSIPNQLRMNHFAYKQLVLSAAKLNQLPPPN